LGSWHWWGRDVRGNSAQEQGRRKRHVSQVDRIDQIGILFILLESLSGFITDGDEEVYLFVVKLRKALWVFKYFW
jgi:hypothetical protein